MVDINEGDVFSSRTAQTFKVLKENHSYYDVLNIDVLGHPVNQSVIGKINIQDYIKENGYRKGCWVARANGGRYYPFDPRPEDIDINDIAQSLSYTYRFKASFTTMNGFPISVARHCINLSKIPSDDKEALAYLLHDAIEAYIGDMLMPLKDEIPDFERVEMLGLKAIEKKFGVTFNNPQLHIDDKLMAKDELFFMDREALYQWEPHYLPKFILTSRSLEYGPAEDKKEFLHRFSTLTS